MGASVAISGSLADTLQGCIPTGAGGRRASGDDLDDLIAAEAPEINGNDDGRLRLGGHWVLPFGPLNNTPSQQATGLWCLQVLTVLTAAHWSGPCLDKQTDHPI